MISWVNMHMSRERIYRAVIAALFLFLIIFRIHNARAYNPYWGYDGGAHLAYIESVFRDLHLPASLEENYLAWHEPLFYVNYALVGRLIGRIVSPGSDYYQTIVKTLQLVSAGMSVLLVYLAYRIAKIMAYSRPAQIAVVAGAGFLSVLSETSNYLTNELLVAVLILLSVYLTLEGCIKGFRFGRVVALALVLSAAFLTKLSALIAVLSVALWFMFYWISHRGGYRILWVPFILFTVLMSYAPWLVFRQRHFAPLFNLNPYEARLAEERNLPKHFFLSADLSFLKNPFWTVDARSFWNIVYADAFSDYYVIGQRADSETGVAENISATIMTDSGRFVARQRWNQSRLLLALSLFPLALWVLGYANLVRLCVRERGLGDREGYLLILITVSFAALAFNVARYPFLERGTLKAGFILFVWPLLFIAGFGAYEKIVGGREKWWIPVWVLMLGWVYLSTVVNWIYRGEPLGI